jgi:hypothetical protein
MVRTGPSRRQRIGDVAAGMMVVAAHGRAAERGPPRWLLPAATLLATAFSAVFVLAMAEAGKQPLDGAQQAQFIAGCQNGPNGEFLDCRCLLDRLEAAGARRCSVRRRRAGVSGPVTSGGPGHTDAVAQ